MPGCLLAVASTGGHLNELSQLLGRLSPPPERVEWVTFDTAQSRSLLAEETVHYVRPTPTRAPVSVLRNVPPAARLLRQRRPSMVVSTGAGIALSYLPMARAFRIPAHYIESATRLTGPSATGRILAVHPGIQTYTQDRRWSDRRWSYRGSVFDAFEQTASASGGDAVRRVVVVLGTNPYPFRRLIERLVEILPSNVEVLWQTGVTDTDGLPIEARPSWPARDLHSAMSDADVVVAHAGVGAALDALASGRIPVLVPRRRDQGEQIDDHQLLVASELADRGLAVVAEPDALDLSTLADAARRRAKVRADAPAFVLGP